MVNVNANTYLPSSDFNLIVLLCAPFVFLLLGSVGWLVYFMLKKGKKNNAIKTGLITFTILITGTMATSFTKFRYNSTQRKEYLHLRELREKYIQFCTTEIKSYPSMKGIDSANEKTRDFCYCVFDKFENSKSVRQVLLNLDEPNQIPRNEESEHLKRQCYDEYFGN